MNTTDMQQQKISSHNQIQTVRSTAKKSDHVLPDSASETTLQFPLITPDLVSMDFARFDSKFGGSLPTRTTIPAITKPYIPTTTIATTLHYPHFLQTKSSPSLGRSWNLFRDHPAKGIDMDTGAYSLTVSL